MECRGVGRKGGGFEGWEGWKVGGLEGWKKTLNTEPQTLNLWPCGFTIRTFRAADFQSVKYNFCTTKWIIGHWILDNSYLVIESSVFYIFSFLFIGRSIRKYSLKQ